MELLAKKEPEELTDEDRRIIAMYSGWGGLSLERVADRFPKGFPIPDSTGLIHEYYIYRPVRTESHEISYLRRELSRSDRVRAGPVR